MFKTIFGKQFVVYALALGVSFAAVALVLSGAFRAYFVSEKTAVLTRQGQQIAQSYVRQLYSVFTGMPVIMGRGNWENDIRTLQEYLGASVFIVDEEGAVTAYTTDIATLQSGAVVTYQPLLKALSGEAVAVTGNGGGLFDEVSLTVGCPILLDNGYILGAVYVKVPMAEVTRTTGNVARLTLLVLLSSLALAFVLIYVSSRAISKPIRQMSEAAKEVAAGDFSKRLAVKGRDEVAQLAGAFNDMADSLGDVERARREFVANISHDLRSPLTSMKGFAQAILDGVVPYDAQDRYLSVIVEESDRLAKLAHDILDADAARDIRLNRAAFDVNEMVRRAVALFERRARAKNLRVQLTFERDPAFIDGDAEKLSRVLFNLLDNAVKFAADGGRVTVWTRPVGGKVRIGVADDGSGMTREESRRVFDRFYKADLSRGADKAGHGLGLSIVKAFVLAHGETVDLKTAPGEGCEFSFAMPEADRPDLGD